MIKFESEYKKIIFYLLLIFILSISFILRNFVFSPFKNTSIRQSALLNSKYEKNVSKFEITILDRTLILSKIDEKEPDSLWLASYKDDPSFIFPVANNRVNQFLKELIAIKNIEQVATKIESWEKYGVTENYGTKVRIYTTDLVSELIFGNETFNGKKIYCKTSKSSTVYSIQNDFYPWLSTDTRNWGDLSIIAASFWQSQPFTFRQSVVDIEKAKSAVGSEIINANDFFNQIENIIELETFTADFGDGGKLILKFFSDNNIVYMQPQYFPGISASSSIKKIANSISYILTMSEWSYNRLFK